MHPVTAQNIDGLLIKLNIRDAASKDAVKEKKLLRDWKPVRYTPEKWIRQLAYGHAICLGTFNPDKNGIYRHKKELWQSGYMIFTDGDNFAGVDFDDEGEDEHLNGIDPWIDREELYNQFPSLKSKAFAVTESVSSMSPEKNHRRYRIAFLFDEPITSREDFGKLLTALATEFRVIDPTDRAPSQPVFGNAREETRDNAEIFGNVLSLKDYLSDTEPEPPAAAAAAPTPTATPPSKKKPSVDISLDEFIKQNGIATLGSRPNGGHYVECPNRSNHTDEKNGKTDAYIWENEDGTYAFYCSHAHCVDKRTWAYFRDRVAPKRKRSESPPPLNTQQKKAPTLDEVLDNIKAYEKAPETATLNDVCEAISTLDSLIEKEAAIQELSELKNDAWVIVDETSRGGQGS